MPAPRLRFRCSSRTTKSGLPLLLLVVGTLSLALGHSLPDDPTGDEPSFLVLPYLQLPTTTGMTIMWETDRRLPSRVEYGLTKELGSEEVVEGRAKLHELRLKELMPGTTYFYRAVSGDLKSDVYSFRTAPPAGTKRWRMALYGDSRTNSAIHRKVVEQIAKANVDLIVHTGDIVTNGRNHESWRREFFEPLEPIAHSVPWVSTIGNHERDSENYFSYMALPGNEHYFGLDYANAHLVCLDSNAWIAKGRDSQQYHWAQEHFKQERDATWTFVIFHHPLFSAHATRPINALRWDWAPLLVDPTSHIDAVLTGHDHFYARNYRMGYVREKPQAGVLFLTSAGGGASLYRSVARDYVAKEKSAHHFTLFDFDGDKVTIVATDIAGKEIDHYVLTKDPTEPEEFCSFEMEQFRHFLRQALTSAEPIRLLRNDVTVIDQVIKTPTRFSGPLSGRFIWKPAKGWKLKQEETPFKIEPGQALEIPLQAEVAAGPVNSNPALAIVFDEGKFRNRTVEATPWVLSGPEQLEVHRVDAAIKVNGKLDESCWKGAGQCLLGLPPRGGRGDTVWAGTDDEWFYIAFRLDDPDSKVLTKMAAKDVEGSRLLLFNEHVRILLSDGKRSRTFIVSPANVRYASDDDFDELADSRWKSAVASERGAWCVEVAIGRKLFADWSKVRINFAHRRQEDKDATELLLNPSFTLGADPDRMPDAKPDESYSRLVPLKMPR
ncbi:MAG: metallophosphoesterase [Gemmataceae bacterium]